MESVSQHFRGKKRRLVDGIASKSKRQELTAAKSFDLSTVQGPEVPAASPTSAVKATSVQKPIDAFFPPTKNVELEPLESTSAAGGETSPAQAVSPRRSTRSSGIDALENAGQRQKHDLSPGQSGPARQLIRSRTTRFATASARKKMLFRAAAEASGDGSNQQPKSPTPGTFYPTTISPPRPLRTKRRSTSPAASPASPAATAATATGGSPESPYQPSYQPLRLATDSESPSRPSYQPLRLATDSEGAPQERSLEHIATHAHSPERQPIENRGRMEPPQTPPKRPAQPGRPPRVQRPQGAHLSPGRSLGPAAQRGRQILLTARSIEAEIQSMQAESREGKYEAILQRSRRQHDLSRIRLPPLPPGMEQNPEGLTPEATLLERTRRPLPQHFLVLRDLAAALDTVLNVFALRKEIPDFDSLRPAVERLSGKAFTRAQLARILALYPDGYRVFVKQLNIHSSGVRRSLFSGGGGRAVSGIGASLGRGGGGTPDAGASYSLVVAFDTRSLLLRLDQQREAIMEGGADTPLSAGEGGVDLGLMQTAVEESDSDDKAAAAVADPLVAYQALCITAPSDSGPSSDTASVATAATTNTRVSSQSASRGATESSVLNHRRDDFTARLYAVMEHAHAEFCARHSISPIPLGRWDRTFPVDTVPLPTTALPTAPRSRTVSPRQALERMTTTASPAVQRAMAILAGRKSKPSTQTNDPVDHGSSTGSGTSSGRMTSSPVAAAAPTTPPRRPRPSGASAASPTLSSPDRPRDPRDTTTVCALAASPEIPKGLQGLPQHLIEKVRRRETAAKFLASSPVKKQTRAELQRVHLPQLAENVHKLFVMNRKPVMPLDELANKLRSTGARTSDCGSLQVTLRELFSRAPGWCSLRQVGKLEIVRWSKSFDFAALKRQLISGDA